MEIIEHDSIMCWLCAIQISIIYCSVSPIDASQWPSVISQNSLISIPRSNICTKEGWLLRLLFCCQTFWYSQNSAHFIVHFICQLHSNQIDFLLFPRSTEASATSPGNFYKNLNNRFLDQTLSNVLLMFEISRGKKSHNFQYNWIFLPLRSTRHQSDA